MKQEQLFEKTKESNRLWDIKVAEEKRIMRQRMEKLRSEGYAVGEPYPGGNMATPGPLMAPQWHPTQMRGPCGTPVAPQRDGDGMAVTPHHVNWVIYQQTPFGTPIQGQFGPFYPGSQPFMVPLGFQQPMVYPLLTSNPGPNLNPNSGSTYNPAGTFATNSSQSFLGSSINSSPDLSRRSIATTTTTTTTTTSSAFRGTISTPTRRF
jgi:hypothetical protein